MKLEINHRKKIEKKKITLRLNDILLRTQWVNDEIKEEILKYLETNDNGITAYQNIWGAETEVLKDKLIEMNA